MEVVGGFLGFSIYTVMSPVNYIYILSPLSFSSVCVCFFMHTVGLVRITSTVLKRKDNSDILFIDMGHLHYFTVEYDICFSFL